MASRTKFLLTRALISYRVFIVSPAWWHESINAEAAQNCTGLGCCFHLPDHPRQLNCSSDLLALFWPRGKAFKSNTRAALWPWVGAEPPAGVPHLVLCLPQVTCLFPHVNLPQTSIALLIWRWTPGFLRYVLNAFTVEAPAVCVRGIDLNFLILPATRSASIHYSMTREKTQPFLICIFLFTCCIFLFTCCILFIWMTEEPGSLSETLASMIGVSTPATPPQPTALSSSMKWGKALSLFKRQNSF